MSTKKKEITNRNNEGRLQGFNRSVFNNGYCECTYKNGKIEGLFKGFYLDNSWHISVFLIDDNQEGEKVRYD